MKRWIYARCALVAIILAAVAGIRWFASQGERWSTGRYLFSLVRIDIVDGSLKVGVWLGYDNPLDRSLWRHFLDFWFQRYVGESSAYTDRPLWEYMLMFAALAGAFAAARHQLRPAPPGFCKKCRYDLRGSCDRCPECGTPFTNDQQVVAGKLVAARISGPVSLVPAAPGSIAPAPLFDPPSAWSS